VNSIRLHQTIQIIMEITLLELDYETRQWTDEELDNLEAIEELNSAIN